MTARPHSIRRALIARLTLPLLLLMVLGGAAAFGMARHFSQVVLDQWLYDSAVSLANRVHWNQGRTAIDLPRGAREILEWDRIDRVYFQVVSEHGERLAGNGVIPRPRGVLRAAHESPVYYDTRIGGDDVRVVAVGLASPGGEPIIVSVAETRHKRNTLASQLLWISVALSAMLVAASTVLTWHAVGSGIASMEKAVSDVRRIHRRAPLEPIVSADIPREALPLVEQINELIGGLAAAHRLNQRFVADAAHQLRTPVATLRVQLELARREKDPERHAKAVDDAVDALTRMSHMLHQLLTLAHADETDPDACTRGLADLDRIARQEVERRLDDALAAGVDLGYDGPGSPVLVPGKDELLREAVANLLDNSIRYGGGGAVTVGVSSGELYVEDAGPGIHAAERAKVCDRFYRVPGSPGNGCGLGLAIVAEIARRHRAAFLLDDAATGAGLRARLVFSG